MPELIDKVCVARDEKVGVYGFVFLRDGVWADVIVSNSFKDYCSYTFGAPFLSLTLYYISSQVDESVFTFLPPGILPYL